MKKIKWIVIGVVVLGIIGVIFSKEENKETVQEKATVQNEEEDVRETFSIESFEYTLEDNNIFLERYKGKDDALTIDASYNVDGKDYATNLSEFQVSSDFVKTLIINEGITELNNSIFNSCEVTKVYLPKSLSVIYDNTIAYLWSDDKIALYYGGSEDDWNNVFEEYEIANVKDKIDEGDAEGAGSALADKLNKMVGHEFDASQYEMHYDSSPVDVE